MLLIDNTDVAAVLRMRDVVQALEESYADLTTGDGVCRPRIDVRLPSGEGDAVYQWGSMEGGSRRSGYFAVRVKSDIISEHEYAGTRTQEKYCSEPGLFCGLVWLFSTRTGEPLAILNDGLLQHMRVGADSAIGTRLAARPDAEVVGMLGSGGMARSHLEALVTVRPITRLQVYSPTRANRELYAAEMAERYGIEAIAVSDPSEVYRGADILCACTDAAKDVISGDSLDPGTHVTSIGGRPDARTRQRVDVWLRLGTAPAPVSHPGFRPTDEYIVYRGAPDSPVWERHQHDQKHQRPPVDGEGPRVVYLEEVLRDGASVRTSPDQITFSERGNIQGAQFHAVAGKVFELAQRRGVGRVLPTEWFLQDIRD
jgi:alanine dehydrogenase